MIKQAVIIEFENKPIYVADIRTFKDTHELLEFKKECENNLKELLKAKDEQIETLRKNLIDAGERITKLELEGKLNRGEITQEEYDNVVE